ncbi:MAG: VWA domain-containing protein [Thermoanaerobaculia bacterium]
MMKTRARLALLVVSLFALAGAALATSGPEPTPAQSLEALPEEERRWLTEFVAPIILPEEETAFLELTEQYQREAFKEEFWKRRERDVLRPPFGPGYRYRYTELRRLADEKYDGWKHDAGRMVLRYGEPTSIQKAEGCRETFRNLEIWTYTPQSALGSQTRHHFFYRRSMMEPRRLWTGGTPDSDIFAPGSCRKSFPELMADCTPQRGDGCYCNDACEVFRVWNEISSRQGSVVGGQMEESQLLAPAQVSLEGLDTIKQRSASSSDPNARKLSVEGPGSSPAAAAAKTAAPSTPAPIRRKLSNKEIKELTAKLAPKYREFLETVDLIITNEEKQVFLQIADDYQKDRFIEAFWKRRSIDAQGLRTDYRQVYTRRLEAAHEQFKNLYSDRAKIFVLNGPPDAVIPIDCPEVFVPIQIWFYQRLEVLKSKVYLIFYRPYGIAEYKLWLPLDGEGVLEVGVGSSGPAARRASPELCFDARSLLQAINYTTAVLGSGAMAMAGASKLFEPPTVETEGVDQILSMTTEPAAGASPLNVARLVRFPEQRANKIGVDISLLVPKGELRARTLGAESVYNVDVIGEVVKEDRLIDNFKYRFDISTEEAGTDKIPLTVRRYLYPGEYNLVLKVSDGNQNAEGRLSDKLTVPEQPDAPPQLEAAARGEARTAVDKAREPGLMPAAIAVLPVAKEIVTGLQRFETRTAEGVRAVDFYLNGTKVMTKTRPPFEADVDLGPLPRRQTVRVVAYGETGRLVGEDEYTVNEGKDVFRVRILSPGKGARVSGPTKVLAAVAVPEGKTLQKLEFYSNETRVAILYQAPFEQVVNIHDSKSLGYVRVLGTLDDGTVAEDVRYVNAPAYISEVSVDAVELYTTVADKGRPVAGLQASNFKVFEDGALQKIESFEYVKNLPLSLGVMVDTSASMLESLPDAEQAALSFLDYSVGPKDRALTVSFDNEPYLLCKLTNRKEKLSRSLGGLRAEGSTALYDAIIYGLYQFTGVKGKKALVLLTDGKDTASKFDFDTLLEYVRKAGIAIYGIGLKISGTELEVKHKLNKLAQATGGQTFYIDSVKNLETVYRQINEELRSQYLLTYYSTNSAGRDKWRRVEVRVEPANLQARTVSGYYP